MDNPEAVPGHSRVEAFGINKYIKDRSEYVCGRLLGKGACGIVHLATEKATERQVAMKELFDVDDAHDQKLFIREIILPVRIGSIGIVPLLGFCLPSPKGSSGPDDSSLSAVLIMEYMPNGTLQDVCDKLHQGEKVPHFTPTEHSKVLYGVAITMAEVHDHRIIHRDLKPGNVFLDDKWEPRIADFGLSRLASSNLQLTMAVGSPLFMAPELYAESEEPYSKPVDVYAYAGLVYQTFTSNVEMDDDVPNRSAQQMLLRIMRGVRLKKAKEIPDQIWNLKIGRAHV
jgi:serine/threonine protein kinase